MAKFMKSHYDAVAMVLRGGKPDGKLRDELLKELDRFTKEEIAMAYYKGYVKAFAMMFEEDNPRFDINKWRSAVGDY